MTRHRRPIYRCIVNLFLGSMLLPCVIVSAADDLPNDNDCPIVMPNFDDMFLLTREERIQLMDQALEDALSQVQDCRQKLTDMQKQNNQATSAASSSSAVDSNSEADNEADSEADSEANNEVDSEADNEADSESDSTDNSENNAEAQQNKTQTQQTATPSSDLSGNEASEQSSVTKSSVVTEMEDASPSSPAIPNNELSGSDLPDPERTAQPSSGEQSPTPTIIKDNKKVLDNGKLPEDIPPVDNDDIIAKQIRAAAQAEPDPEKQTKLWNEYRRYKGISEK